MQTAALESQHAAPRNECPRSARHGGRYHIAPKDPKVHGPASPPERGGVGRRWQTRRSTAARRVMPAPKAGASRDLPCQPEGRRGRNRRLPEERRWPRRPSTPKDVQPQAAALVRGTSAPKLEPLPPSNPEVRWRHGAQNTTRMRAQATCGRLPPKETLDAVTELAHCARRTGPFQVAKGLSTRPRRDSSQPTPTKWRPSTTSLKRWCRRSSAGAVAESGPVTGFSLAPNVPEDTSTDRETGSSRWRRPIPTTAEADARNRGTLS